MLAYTYVEHGRFELLEKPRPILQDERDAIVRVTLAQNIFEKIRSVVEKAL